MKNFLTCYKFFKSFKIPVLKEDNFEVEILQNNKPVKGLFKLKNLNLKYFSLSSNITLESEDLEIKISHKKLFRKTEIKFKAKTINNYLSSDNRSQIIVLETDEEVFKSFVQEFIFSFSKKRLKKYLIKSSLEDLNYNNEEVSEIVTLLKTGFQGLQEKYKDDLGNLLLESSKSINSENANLYLINTSNNTLEKKYSSLNEDIISEIDYRKGIPGIVFSGGEIVNIYNSRFMDFYNENESADSYLAIPLYNRYKDIIGVLEYKNKKNEKRFNKRDEDIISFMSVLFSSYFKMYKPVHSSSKLKSFNPGLRKEIHLLESSNELQDSIYAIQKVKGQLESILINSCDHKTLEVVIEDIIESSHAYDWNQVIIDCKKGSLPTQRLNDESIIIIKNVESCNPHLQSDILDYLEDKKVWVITTYFGKDVNTGLFNSDFQKTIARHHINFYTNESKEELNHLIEECVHSTDNMEGFDKKVQSFEDVINQLHQNDQSKNNKSAA